MMNFKQKPYRSQKYLAFVRTLNCSACKTTPCHAHHVRGKNTGMQTKPPDTHCIPLCPSCHEALHRLGAKEFCMRLGIDLGMERYRTLLAYLWSNMAEDDFYRAILPLFEQQVEVLEGGT